MEPESDRPAGNKTGDEPEDDKASVRSPAPSAAGAPRRALRERGAGRQKAGVSSLSPPDTNGATPGQTPNTGGRVLRDRSRRTVPAWLQSDKESDTDGEESSPGDTGAASRRRKAACPRRRKTASTPAAATGNTGGEDVDVDDKAPDSQDSKKPSDAQAPRSRRAQTQPRAKAPPTRAARGSAKPVCKSEPGTDAPTVEVEAKVLGKKTAGIEKKEEEEEEEEDDDDDDDEDILLGEEEPPFQDDPSDLNYQPQAQRDAPKPRRRPPPRQKEKKERVLSAKEKEKEPEIKMEGGESVKEVKMENEFGEAAEPPRKRGRRRKDDKTPRLPKRRKKPPVQYVRCEIEGCGTVLAHPRYLQHHIKYQHLLKKKYVCPHPSCGRLFRLQKQLLRHAKHHTDQRDYICEFCARAFKSSHNLAVHRMIHTGEKPLQCEICGFTCRQKASLNWHMKKHDADAFYQFSCSICGKKFEKKDSVVAHKAKSHPEVLIAEALAANAGALITTPASLLLEAQGNPVPVAVVPGVELAGLEVSQVSQLSQVTQQVVGQMQQVSQLSQVGQMSQVSHQVVVVGQDQSLHTMQVPVTIALSALDTSSPSDSSQHTTHLQLQMPLQFVSAGPAQQSQQQQQQQIQQLALHSGSMMSQQAQLQQLPLQAYGQQQGQQGQTQILHMTFQPVTQGQNHIQQIPMLTTAQQLQTLTSHAQTPNPTLLPQLQPQLQLQTQVQLQLQAQDPTSGSRESYVLEDAAAALSSSSPSANALQQVEVGTVGEGVGVVWERAGDGVTEGTEEHVQHSLM